MNATPATSAADKMIFSLLSPHTASEAVQEFHTLPEHAYGSADESLNTDPAHPDKSFYFFRNEQYAEDPKEQQLQVARVQHDPDGVKVIIDSFDFDSHDGMYSFASSSYFDRKRQDWVQLEKPHFLTHTSLWLCLDDLRDTYGNGREIPEGRVDQIYKLHDHLVLMQDPPCFTNQSEFNSAIDALMSVMKDLENTVQGTFTILGDEIHPNRYRLCYSDGMRGVVIEDLTISADVKFRTQHGSFDSLDALKERYNLRTSISTDSGDDAASNSSEMTPADP
jgi:hypothetical protein